MAAAWSAFICTLLVAWSEGYGGRTFAWLVLRDGVAAAVPFLLVSLVAAGAVRLAAARGGASGRAAWIALLSMIVQAAIALATFGWWWLEPHAVLTAWTGGSLQSRWWMAAFGAASGMAAAGIVRVCRDRDAAASAATAAVVAFLIGGGAVYRAADHVAAGERAVTAVIVAAAALAAALLGYAALRNRGRRGKGIAAVAAAGASIALVALSGPNAASSRRESVVLVLVDTLRADMVTAYGAPNTATMPELARIARDGTMLTQAVSPAPWTLPATMSLLSGWNPHRHRAGVSTSPWEVLPGDPGASYLGPSLRDAGYVVGAFVNNPYLRRYFGFGHGHLLFRHYHGRAGDGVSLFLEWLGAYADTPFFAMLHVMDPHWPFDAPAGFGRQRQPCAGCDSLADLLYRGPTQPMKTEVIERYMAEVRYTDTQLGRLYDELAGRGVLDQAWLIVTADHGEELWDHGGFLHGHTLYDELLRVPLLVVPPRSRTGVTRGNAIGWQVRLEDVAATVLEVAGLDARLAPDGESLLPMLARPLEFPRAVRVQVSGYVKNPVDLRYALRGAGYKAVMTPAQPAATQLFDLQQDPGEWRDLLSGAAPAHALAPAALGALQNLQQWVAGRGLELERTVPVAASSSVPDADLQRQLRSLGYAQ